MKPKPLVELNHFTVPVVMRNPPFGKTCRSPNECSASSERFRKGEFIRAAPKRENNKDRPSKYRQKPIYTSTQPMSMFDLRHRIIHAVQGKRLTKSGNIFRF